MCLSPPPAAARGPPCLVGASRASYRSPRSHEPSHEPWYGEAGLAAEGWCRDYLALFSNDPLHFTPGERFEYSNGGCLVLGAIVEKVSGTSYFDYVAQHILAPAGRTRTAFSAISDSVPSRAVGYMFRDSGGSHQTLDFATPAPAAEPHGALTPTAAARREGVHDGR